MILLCSGQNSPKHFDALLLLAHQLEDRGYSVAIDQRFLPDETTKHYKYEMAPFLADVSTMVPTTVIIVGANSMVDETQVLLGSLQLNDMSKIWGLGHFEDLQTKINTRNKIAYATGREPNIYDLAESHNHFTFDAPVTPFLTAIRDEPIQNPEKKSRVLVYLPFDEEDELPDSFSHLSTLQHSLDVELHLLTNSKGKDIVRKSRYSGLSVFSYGELPPTALLSFFDVLVFLGPNVPGERMGSLAVIAMAAGKVVVDCTQSFSFAASGAPVLKGPDDLAALSGYLHQTVFRNRFEIGERTRQSQWLSPFDISEFENCLKLPEPKQTLETTTPRTIFFPTNGNGLGHATRCVLLADELNPDQNCTFAAFPSCVEMVRNTGIECIPMVSRSSEHTDEYAADLLNYIRLRSLVRRGDQIVFDGGYVFDSVYRLVSSKNLRATWIRRGLWQTSQVTPLALERERVFSDVIVPAEAFQELNRDYTSGDHIHKVGPIVQKTVMTKQEIESLRDRLSIEFDCTIDTLVVSMLGGGVASERTAQTQLLCSMLESRSNSLHLILAWPNANIHSGLYGWDNSQVVRSSRAIELCLAADLVVSAAGYNSFHELLYAQVPAIFIPQSAPFLDDQERRAFAAAERGLSVMVKEDEMFKLEREVGAFLDDGKSGKLRQALRNESFQMPGNAEAARIIEEGLLT